MRKAQASGVSVYRFWKFAPARQPLQQKGLELQDSVSGRADPYQAFV